LILILRLAANGVLFAAGAPRLDAPTPSALGAAETPNNRSNFALLARRHGNFA